MCLSLISGIFFLNGASETREPEVTAPDAEGILSRVDAFFLAPQKIQIHHVSKAKTYFEL
jgi:hypothetical protein